jgi:hypothetical protein
MLGKHMFFIVIETLANQFCHAPSDRNLKSRVLLNPLGILGYSKFWANQMPRQCHALAL